MNAPATPTPAAEQGRLLWTRRQTATLLQVSLGTLDDATRRGLIRPVRLGKSVVRYARAEVERFLREAATVGA